MDKNIRKYIALLKTVEYGSFTRAAEELSYSQSGVSRMIQDLEKEWGVTLVERDRGGVTLTSDGLKLFPYVQRLYNEYLSLQMQVDQLRGLQSGIIRIATFSSVATHWMPNILQEFQKLYPNIHFELLIGDYGEIESWVQSGRVDCGFTLGPVARGLTALDLERDPLMAVLPHDHPLAGEKRFPVAALKDYPFMLLEKGGRSEIADFLDANGIQLEPSIVSLDDYAIMSMVEKGLGISILPRLILQRCPYHICIKELDAPAYRQICFVYRDFKRLSLAARRLLDYLNYR